MNSPDRLTVKADCVTVRGIAGCITTNPGDGDTTINLLLDEGQSRYLTPANTVWKCRSDQGSDLAPRIHVEVIPQHCEVKETNCADLVPFKDPKIPKNGQHVSVTGAWVLDTSHNRGFHDWAEIHPAARIVVLE